MDIGQAHDLLYTTRLTNTRILDIPGPEKILLIKINLYEVLCFG